MMAQNGQKWRTSDAAFHAMLGHVLRVILSYQHINFYLNMSEFDQIIVIFVFPNFSYL